MSWLCDVEAEFYKWSEPVARKQHQCCECSAPILKGEKHFSWTGKWDNVIDSGRQHFACMEACMLIRDKFEGGDCIPFGCLKEAFDELRTDNWYPAGKDRYKKSWKQLRHLMAVILWRERKHERLQNRPE